MKNKSIQSIFNEMLDKEFANNQQVTTNEASYAPVWTGGVITDQKEIIKFLTNKLGVWAEDISFDPDGSVNVDNVIDFGGIQFDKIPMKFGKASSNFMVVESKIKSLENSPREVGANCNISRNDITNFVGGPRIVAGRFSASHNLNLNSIEGIPESLGSLSIFGCPKLTSLQNIHKMIKQFKFSLISATKKSAEGYIFIGDHCNLSSHILGTLLIPGIKGIYISPDEKGQPTGVPAIDIVNKYIALGGGHEHIFKCQQELVSNGFKEFAKL